MPDCAQSAASTPQRAASPAFNGLPIVPNWDLSPDAIVLAKPIAARIWVSDKLSNRAAAIVAPKAPAVAV